MKVLLRSDIAGVGRRGDIITVSGGHARNFLLPKGLAIEATDGAVVQAEVMRKSRDQRESAERNDAQAVSTKLMQSTFALVAGLAHNVGLDNGAIRCLDGQALWKQEVASMPTGHGDDVATSADTGNI